MREPNFHNLLKVLNKEKPERPTLFEFFLHERLYEKLSGLKLNGNRLNDGRVYINAYKNAGYDYTTVMGSGFSFPTGEIKQEKTRSINEGSIIHDRESFEKYPWLAPDNFDYSHLRDLKDDLPDGMKLIIWGPGGVLENVIFLVGYDNLCFMIYENPQLAEDIFEAVGTRLIRYYELSAKFDTVGSLISNDDWGFNTQTLLSPDDLRRYVFPWHKKIVEIIHATEKPVILHSCGNLVSVMDDIIDDLKYDGKHSYQDNIVPVEDEYEKLGSRIAILGGIDLDFVCRAKPEEIKRRSKDMLKRTEKRGGYALGTGNSVPDYVPDENYFAMISAALEE